MIKKSSSHSSKPAASATKHVSTTQHASDTKLSSRKLDKTPSNRAENEDLSDKTTISSEVKEKKAENMPNIDALTDNLSAKKTDKATEDGKADDKKAEDGKADKTDKNEKAGDKKYPPEVQAKIDDLEAKLKQAEKTGDKKEIERLQKELDKLKNPAADKPGQTEGETTPSEGGGTPEVGGGGSPSGGGGSPAAGGGSPSGGGSPAAGGGSPAAGGGSPAGGADSGGGAPVGGANEAGAAQPASSEEVKKFLEFAASAYGVNPTLLSEIARRESNFNTGDIANNWDSNAKKGTPSKGMFQFIQPTAASMMPKAKQANPQAWQGVTESWTDWKAQALTCAWAISTGQGKHWSTYNSALATAGGNPRGPSGGAQAMG